MSLPSWERGLKFHDFVRLNGITGSLPSWERGLKFMVIKGKAVQAGRSPRGSVD